MREINGKTYIENEKHDIAELLEIVNILRSPEGCSWDREQTFESMRECLKNESQEVIDAIDKKDYDNLKEELGDVLLQVLLNAEIASEKGLFDFGDVVQTLSEKLIRRHPHVFGDIKPPETPEEALALWKSVKQKEREINEKK
ncbi:MAG: nucleotide pyrophosphohydrolase [Clostridia bacterium]|nr:nucleotide pyrophosphohydrolase [Clostridia bacterium]